MSFLQHVDAQSKGVFDIVFQDLQHPFVRCMNDMSKLCSPDVDNPVRSLLQFHDASWHSEMLRRSGQMSFSFYGQLRFRFLHFMGKFPLELISLLHPATSQAQKLQVC